eukprot:CAMPEP_0184866194 /NCGR_PEP_ID=MMETSP0580-20130426/21266_1 /TAXON_ID=1118495 /ORGANISM="Dactyliosolen fragilissimus" /LENGTH=394 /DNA_ID=CAMNT_0027365729 /DNA_START=31 /DNA_END=1215 /DNA_ORIENTATION=+
MTIIFSCPLISSSLVLFNEPLPMRFFRGHGRQRKNLSINQRSLSFLKRRSSVSTFHSSNNHVNHEFTVLKDNEYHTAEMIINQSNSEHCLSSSRSYSERNWKRRNVLTTIAILGGAGIVIPEASHAGNNSTDNINTEPGVLSASEVVKLLASVPTFTIVDKRGVPYTVVGEDAKLTAYFFISFEEAKRILELAKKSSDKTLKDLKKEINEKRLKDGMKPLKDENEIAQEVGINPWKDARISTVPLDFALTLASKGKIAGSYFKISPSQSDVEDALQIETSLKDLAEGKVPLFYIEDLKLPKEAKTPLYFQKSQLLKEWKSQHPTASRQQNFAPKVQVTELFATITELLKPGGTDQDLKSLIFVPPSDSLSNAKNCIQNGGNEVPFKMGERIIIL